MSPDSELESPGPEPAPNLALELENLRPLARRQGLEQRAGAEEHHRVV